MSYWQRGCDDAKESRPFCEPVKGGSQVMENRGYRKGYAWGMHVSFGLCPACMGSGEGRTAFNGYMDVATACDTCGGTGESSYSRTGSRNIPEKPKEKPLKSTA
jgi:hypothetical protein